MIESISVGVDIVDINRFRQFNYKENHRFFERVFSKSEIKYCLKFKNSGEHFAGKFAVKECVRKCIGKNVRFVDIITNHQNSKPIVSVKNRPKYIFQVSLSHEKNLAIAFVLCEKLT